MIIKISENRVTIDNDVFLKSETVDVLNSVRNEQIDNILEYLNSIEEELSKSIENSDFKNLPLSQYVTEGNIYLLRSLKENIEYMKVYVKNNV